MKPFLLKIVAFLAFIAVTIYLISMRADGYTDPFYLRFTTPKQSSLILGTSRAAQDLHPFEINNLLSRNDLYNYAFTIQHSPFGPVYLNSIKRKLNLKSTDGLFIIAVDPWSISSKCNNPNELTEFRELESCVAKTFIVNMKPNIIYLFQNFRYFELLQTKTSPMFLHDDGWLELTVDIDSSLIKKRTDKKIETYKKTMLPYYKFSKVRLSYLVKTIHFLKQHGKVFLVRLPIHPRMMELEQILMPDFDSIIHNATLTCDNYFNMTYLDSDFDYIDGNHQTVESGKEATQILARWIQSPKEYQHYLSINHAVQ